MNRTLLFTIALVATVLAGCSKDSESMEEQERNNMEQTNALTKEQIVGVWRRGDYWVSFSEDGFMCGYLSDKCIVEGGYTIFQDQIIVVSDFFENNITAFKITDISDGKLECSVKYSEIKINSIVEEDPLVYKETMSLKSVETTMSFAKSKERPTDRENEIVGKRFQYYSIYTLNPELSFGGIGDMDCLSDGMFNDKGAIQRMIFALMPDGNPNIYIGHYTKGFYVYLSPYVYFIERRDESYGVSIPMLIIQNYNIQKKEVSFDQSGIIHLSE